MHAFYRGLGRFTVKFRWVIIVVWLAGAVVVVRALPSLGSQVNNQNTAFLPTNAPDVTAAKLAQPILGNANAEPVLVVAVRANAPLTSADLAATQREAAAVRQVKGVSQVQFSGQSPDHKAILLSAITKTKGFDPQHAKEMVDSILASFPKAGAPPGLHFYVTGQVADSVYQNAQSRSVGKTTQDLSVLFIVLLLFLIFRSVLAPIVTLLPAAIVLTIAGAIIGEIASEGVLKVSEVTQLLLIVLVLGAGTDYGLFLVYRVREGIRDGLESKQAVSRAVERVGESITASAGTVILALVSLLLATFGIYHDLGVPLAIGIATMLLAGLTLLPALLAVLGRAVFWPTMPKPGQNKVGLWGRVASRVVARPLLTLLAGLGLFGLLAAGVFWYSPSGFGGAVRAPKGTAAAKGDNVVRQYFARSSSNPTNLIVELRRSAYEDPAQLQTIEAKLRDSGLFSTINTALSPSGATITPAQLTMLHRKLGPPKGLSPLPPANSGVPVQLYESYRSDAQYISPNGRIVQFAAGLTVGDPGKTAALNEVPRIRATLTDAGKAVGALRTGVAGEAAALYDISSTSDADLLHIVPIAAIAIAILLALVLRSVVAPLYLIASVVLSYLAALGLSTIIFVKLGGSGGITFLLPFLMFIFLLALGEDYNILVMTRIREEAHDHTLKEAVTRAVSKSGPTITSAGLVLAGSFAVLAIAGGGGPSGGQVKDIGVGLALGILMDTFLVRTLLVPSTVVLLGRWNWWPRHIEAGMGYPGTEEHHRWRLHSRPHEEAQSSAAPPTGSSAHADESPGAAALGDGPAREDLDGVKADEPAPPPTPERNPALSPAPSSHHESGAAYEQANGHDAGTAEAEDGGNGRARPAGAGRGPANPNSERD